MKGIIYDCEICKCIPAAKEPRVDNIEYCNGWGDFSNMGISVIGAYNLETNRYHIFLKDNFDEFQKLIDQAEHIIGFNSINFDDQLCRANGLNITTTYDLLCEIRVASGQPPGKTRRGYSLDALAMRNLGTCKSGAGALPPILWQQGQIGKVIDYCLWDVQLTAELFMMGQTHTWLKDPTNGKLLKIKQISSKDVTSIKPIRGKQNPAFTTDVDLDSPPF